MCLRHAGADADEGKVEAKDDGDERGARVEVVGPHDAHDDADGHNEEEQPHLQTAPARRAGPRSIRARGARDVVLPGAHSQSARDRASATRMAASAGKARCCSGPRRTPPWLGVGPLYDSEGPGRAVQRLRVALRQNGQVHRPRRPFRIGSAHRHLLGAEEGVRRGDHDVAEHHSRAPAARMLVKSARHGRG